MTLAHIFESHRLCVRDMKQMTLICEDSPGHVPSLIMEEIIPFPHQHNDTTSLMDRLNLPLITVVLILYKTQSGNPSEGLNKDIQG